MKNVLKKFIVPALLIIVAATSVLLLNNLSNGVNDEIDSFKKLVGTNVIISNDTLLIIDCNVWTQSYMLEDGRSVSPEFIKALEKND